MSSKLRPKSDVQSLMSAAHFAARFWTASTLRSGATAEDGPVLWRFLHGERPAQSGRGLPQSKTLPRRLGKLTHSHAPNTCVVNY
jgi:hypothetical protein